MYSSEGLGYDIARTLQIPGPCIYLDVERMIYKAPSCSILYPVCLDHNSLNYEEIALASKLGLWEKDHLIQFND